MLDKSLSIYVTGFAKTVTEIQFTVYGKTFEFAVT